MAYIKKNTGKRLKNIKNKNRNKKPEYDTVVFNNGTRRPKRKSAKPRSATPYMAIALLCVAFIIAYLIVISQHPAGLIEYIKSAQASIGYGDGYSVSIEGGKPFYTVSADDKYFVVNDSSVICYNSSGKTIFEQNHSFTNPVVKFSDTRYLIYGQGEKEVSVGTYSKNLYSLNLPYGVICSCISDSGGYAVASNADGYNSMVSVYDKNNNKIYEWFSSDETINSLALSPNGKNLAVSTLKVDDGKYVSSVYVLNFDSVTPVMQRSYDDKVVYQLNSVSRNVFSVVFTDSIEFHNFKKDTVVAHESDYSVSMSKKLHNRIIVVRTVAANQDESIVEIYKNNGKLISTFKANSYITDFSYRSGKIYLLGLSEILKLDMNGTLLASADATYDALYIEAIAENTVACIRNSCIDKYVLVEEVTQ